MQGYLEGDGEKDGFLCGGGAGWSLPSHFALHVGDELRAGASHARLGSDRQTELGRALGEGAPCLG